MAERGDISTWGAEVLQVSLFVGTPHRNSATDLLRKIFNEDPATNNESLHPQFGRLGQASTESKNGRAYNVHLQPGRCDLAQHASGEDVPNGGYPATELDVIRVLSHLAAGAEKLVEELTNINRIAVNVRMVKFFSSSDEANTEIATVLPAVIEMDGIRDFVFQINRRDSSGAVEFNRILKWSVEPIQVLADMPGISISGGSTMLREFWAAVVQFDYNTVIPRPIFSVEEARSSIKTLVKSVENTRANHLRIE